MELRVMGRPRERFCKWGHDTEMVGREGRGQCKECRREADRRRSPERHKKRYVPKPPRFSPEWEEARIRRWLEIVRGVDLYKYQATQQRARQFDALYQQLEADVPTPEKA